MKDTLLYRIFEMFKSKPKDEYTDQLTRFVFDKVASYFQAGNLSVTLNDAHRYITDLRPKLIDTIIESEINDDGTTDELVGVLENADSALLHLIISNRQIIF